MSIDLSLTALDCPDPIALAHFYASLLELDVEPLGDFPPEDVTWLEVQRDGVTVLGFQKVDNYVAPTWPEGPVPQQLHLDFHSDDLDKDEAHALEVGARKTEFQPGDTFRVFLDPVGHPFCLVLREELRDS
jgi:predicted enzyme related to lactoylglutathione lyase